MEFSVDSLRLDRVLILLEYSSKDVSYVLAVFV